MNMHNLTRISALCSIALLLSLFIMSSRAVAADFDESTPLICAFTRAVDCDSESGCGDTTLETLDLPPFFKVDFKNKVITDVEAIGVRIPQRKTPIKTQQSMDGTIVLQGIELRGWSMLISEKSGMMTLTASDDDEAFVLFGVCTKL
jgi:hypothetical protein